MPADPPRRPLPAWALPLWLAVALAITGPAWTAEVPVLVSGGEEPDWTGTLWTWWWTIWAITNGVDPVGGAHNFFPVGSWPVAQYNLVDALIFGPLVHLIGPTRGYNLACVLTLVGSGLGGWRLGRVSGASPGAAAFAGLLLEVCTFGLRELAQGRVGQALLLVLALATAEVWRVLRGEGGPRAAAIAGALTAVAALEYWFFGLFVAFACLPALPGAWARRGDGRLRRLALAVVVSAALVAPAVLALAQRGGELAGMQRPYEPWMPPKAWTGGDVGLAMAMLDAQQPLWPLLPTSKYTPDKRPGYWILALSALAFAAPWARRGPWRRALLGVAAVGWVMTLGPWLRGLDGQPLPVPLPWRLAAELIPFFRRLWWPKRFEAVLLLGLAPLAALAIDDLRARLRGGWARAALPSAIALTIAELALWQPVFPVPAGPLPAVDLAFYRELDGALLTLPVAAEDPSSRYTLWMQVLHERPILGGLGDHLAGHRPPAWERAVEGNDLLRALQRVSTGAVGGQLVQPSAVQALVDQGFTWVVLDPEVLPRQSRGRWVDRLRLAAESVLGPPALEGSGGALAWRLRPPDGPRAIPAMVAPPVFKDTTGYRSSARWGADPAQ